MRRHELRTARGYIEALIKANQECHWYIEGIVTPEISEDGKTATYVYTVTKFIDGKVQNLERTSKPFTADDGGKHWDAANFSHCFGWQACHDEDCYHGQMLFPLDGKDYLLVGFNC